MSSPTSNPMQAYLDKPVELKLPWFVEVLLDKKRLGILAGVGALAAGAYVVYKSLKEVAAEEEQEAKTKQEEARAAAAALPAAAAAVAAASASPSATATAVPAALVEAAAAAGAPRPVGTPVRQHMTELVRAPVDRAAVVYDPSTSDAILPDLVGRVATKYGFANRSFPEGFFAASTFHDVNEFFLNMQRLGADEMNFEGRPVQCLVRKVSDKITVVEMLDVLTGLHVSASANKEASARRRCRKDFEKALRDAKLPCAGHEGSASPVSDEDSGAGSSK